MKNQTKKRWWKRNIMGDDKYFITDEQIDKLMELAHLENEREIKQVFRKIQEKQKLKGENK